MILTDLVLAEDKEFFLTRNEEVQQLIDLNPFSSRIRFLLDHQNLSKKSVPNSRGELKPPNCIGS